MSISITTGLGSLLNLGIGAGDIAVLYSTGRQVGNWLTASSGDADFLNLLQEDEHEILRRRGVFDLQQFNKRWGQKIALFINGEPSVISESPRSELYSLLCPHTCLRYFCVLLNLHDIIGTAGGADVTLVPASKPLITPPHDSCKETTSSSPKQSISLPTL